MITKEQLFDEMKEHLIYDTKPSNFFNEIKNESIFSEFPFSLLNNLREVPQSPIHHPEGSVWNHTMLVIDEAAHVKNKSSNAKVFMWAALLHDIGKADTTRNKKGKITAYDHDKLGEELSKQFLQEFVNDADFIQTVSLLVRWHMQILFVVKSMHFADIKSMEKQVDINEVALLGYCDRIGRLGANKKEEEQSIELFIKKCKNN